MMRVGMGNDLHKLAPGKGFRLGGIMIPCQFACEAASDGDVLLHALVDALLGALGLGDIGDWFPESMVRKNEDSRQFIEKAMSLLLAKNGTIVNADCTIHLEKPRLAEWKQIIADTVAELLGVARDQVNIKAKTGEGLGVVGKGLAIAAEAVVLVHMPDDARTGA